MSGAGLSAELNEFDVIAFDASELHSLSKLWGDGATDGLRFSVGMYVPLKTMCAVAKRLRST